MSPRDEGVDVAVVGAGLAGLVAATRAAQLGRRVVLIEAQSSVGGLCRNVEIEGRPFVIGCNDFGSGLPRMLERLGVELEFHPAKTQFVFGDRRVQVPPDLRTMLGLLPRMFELARIVRTVRAAPDDAWFAELAGASRTLDDLLRLLPYALGGPDMLVHQLRSSFSKEFDYGYDKTVVPEGGSGAISEALKRRFTALGGELRLTTRCDSITRVGGEHRLQCGAEDLLARQVISSAPRVPAGAETLRSGLFTASFHFEMDEAFAWPRGVHALGWMPSPVVDWLSALDRGERPTRSGFHLFRPRLPARDGCYGLTGFLFLRRGGERPSEDERAANLRNLDIGLDALAPGLLEHLRWRTVLYPEDYRARFGCDPRPCRYVYAPGVRKPPSLDESSGIHHIGNSVQPPGEHAVGAALSGWRAAEAVHESLSRGAQRAGC